jgi:hypothetical protein
VRNRFCTVCSGELLGKSQRLLSSSRPAQQSLIPTKLAAVLAAQRPANERWQQSLGGHSGDSGRISCSFPFASGAPAVVLHPTIRNGRCRPQPPSPLSNAAFKFRSGLSGPLLFLAIHERADDDDLCQNRPPSFGLPVGPRGFPGLFPSATRTSILVRLIDGHLLASGSLSTHFLQSLSTSFVSCAASHSTQSRACIDGSRCSKLRSMRAEGDSRLPGFPWLNSTNDLQLELGWLLPRARLAWSSQQP